MSKVIGEIKITEPCSIQTENKNLEIVYSLHILIKITSEFVD